MYSLIKYHLANLQLMLERFHQHLITLNYKKCILCTPFGILLGHIVCKQGLLVDPLKISLILSFPPPTNVKMLQAMLGHMGYYGKFIRGYAAIADPMEKLLKKDAVFEWNLYFHSSFDMLKAKMASTPILVFPYWNKEFHVHVDASSVALGVVLVQLGNDDLDHSISFASQKLSFTKKNYTTTECKGIAMVYALQKFRHYLLGGHFKMFTDHSTLKYLVNKPVLGGKICRWILLF